jgi:hypothetical protein
MEVFHANNRLFYDGLAEGMVGAGVAAFFLPIMASTDRLPAPANKSAIAEPKITKSMSDGNPSDQLEQRHNPRHYFRHRDGQSREHTRESSHAACYFSVTVHDEDETSDDTDDKQRFVVTILARVREELHHRYTSKITDKYLHHTLNGAETHAAVKPLLMQHHHS